MLGTLGRMFKDDFAQVPIDYKSIDMKAVAEYQRLRRAMEVIDQWILIPNYESMNELLEILPILQKVQKQRPTAPLYRGFTVGWSSGQNKMDFRKAPDNGHVFEYRLTAPLSFTTSFQIAEDFGKTVVCLTELRSDQALLYITDELAYVISKMRNLEPTSQKEVILFPGRSALKLKVVK